MDEEAKGQVAGQDAGEPREVRLGWQLLVLPLVAVAVIAVGYFLGRGPADTTAGADSDVVVVPNATAEALAQAAPVIQVDPSQGLGGDQVAQIQERYHPLTDTKAPDFQMKLLGSEDAVRLSDYVGQAVLVNFWATWCPPCRLEMPWIQSLYEKYKDQGLVVLGVDAGEKVPTEMVEPTVRQYVESQGLTFPILLDPVTYQLQQSWAVMGLPASFLINPQGTITYVHTGMFPNEATLEDLILRNLPGGEWADQAPVGAEAPAAP